MSRLNAISRSLLGLVLVAGLAVNTTAHADTDLSAQNLQTEIIHRAYPLVGMGLAHLCMKVKANDDAGREACKALFLASTFALGSEIATGLIDSKVIDSPMAAHALASLPFLIKGARMHSNERHLITSAKKNSPYNAQFAYIPYMASGVNQLGQVARRAIAHYADNIQDVATRYGFPQEHKDHVLDVAKSTAALTALSFGTLLFKTSDTKRSLAASLAASAMFTAAYMGRESALEHAKHVSSYLPEYQLSAALSVLGAAGLAFSAPFGVPFIASLALLEAGVFTAAETSISHSTQFGMYTTVAQGLAALLGVVLYIPGKDATTTAGHVRRQTGQALLLPLAFSLGYDFIRNQVAHVHIK